MAGDEFDDSESRALDKSADRAESDTEKGLGRSLWEEIGAAGTAVAEKVSALAGGSENDLDTEMSEIYNGDLGGGAAAEILGLADTPPKPGTSQELVAMGAPLQLDSSMKASGSVAAESSFLAGIFGDEKADKAELKKFGQEVREKIHEKLKEEGLLDTPEKDAGKVHIDKDSEGRVTSYTTPDGKTFGVGYGPDGKPDRVTFEDDNGRPHTYLKNEKGVWVDPDNPKEKPLVQNIEFDEKTKQITMTDGEYKGRVYTFGPDGSFAEKDIQFTDGKQKTHTLVDADGTLHKFDQKTGDEVVTKPGSHLSEVRDAAGKTKGYELKDVSGHVTKIDTSDDGKVTLTRGGRTEEYAKAERDEKTGVLKLTSKDGATLEVGPDGSSVHRDKKGRVDMTVGPDGEQTSFKRDAAGKVTELTVKDAQGRVTDQRTKDVAVNDKDGSYSVTLENGNKVERRVDGTQEVTDKSGTKVESEGDKVLARMKELKPPLTEEQERQFKKDLADIDKLPEAQRKKVYESLDRIAHGENQTKLNDNQRKDIALSLAHQIAHPESIKQGDKMSCTTANAEQTLAREHPDTYADMVAKLATDGKYTTAGGKTIEAQLDKGGHLESKTDYYHQRSYASELFQNGATQLAMKEGDTYKSLPANSPELNPRPDGVTPSTDTGERIVHKDGTTSKFGGLDAQQQADVLNQLAPGDKYKPTEPIKSVDELEQALKKNGGTPLNVGIHLGQESKFTGMSGTEGASGSGYHAVNITHFEKGPPAMVYYENPAGGADHSYPNGTGVPAEDFVKAMQGGDIKMRAVVKGGADGSGGDGKAAGSMGNPMGADQAVAAGAMGKPNDAAKAADDDKVKDYGEGGFAEYHRYRDIIHNDRVKAEREYLLESLPADKREQFKKDMEAFEKRAAADPPLSPREVARTYTEIARLLEAEDKPGIPLNAQDRIRIAEQVMKHAADPSAIDQGDHNTCNVTTVERLMFTKNPSAAAELIASVATTGEYTTRGTPPVTVKVHPDSLVPHMNTGRVKEEDIHPPKDGLRSQASQIFQVTAVNVSHKAHGVEIINEKGEKVQYPPGTVEYRQGDAKPGLVPPDTGERLIDTRTGKEIVTKNGDREGPVSAPEIADDQIVDVYNHINNRPGDDSGFYLANKDYISGKGDKVVQFKDEEDFKKQLAEAQKSGKMPVIVKVNTGQEPFFTDSGGGAAGGSGGAHVVVITKYDEVNGYVQMDNQWGKDSDREVLQVGDLYRATLPPGREGESIARLEKECGMYARMDKPDYGKEMELLRLQLRHGDPKLTQAQYDEQMSWIAKQIIKDAKDNQGGIVDERSKIQLRAWLDEAYAQSPEGKSPRWSRIARDIGGAYALRNDDQKTANVSDVPTGGDYATGDMAKAAKEVHDALSWYDEPDRLEKALSGKTPAQLRQMDKIFKEKYGMSIDMYLAKELDGDEETKFRNQFNKNNPYWHA